VAAAHAALRLRTTVRPQAELSNASVAAVAAEIRSPVAEAVDAALAAAAAVASGMPLTVAAVADETAENRARRRGKALF
jgi:hypothetical protein